MSRKDGHLTSVDVVINLKRDVNEFQEAVISEIDSIKSRAESMGDAWQDSQYRDFMAYIEELSDALKSDVQQLEEAVAALDKEIQ